MKSMPKALHDPRTNPQRGDRLVGADDVLRTVVGRELAKIPSGVLYTQNGNKTPALDPTWIEKCSLWDWMQWAQDATAPQSVPHTDSRLARLLSRLRRRSQP